MSTSRTAAKPETAAGRMQISPICLTTRLLDTSSTFTQTGG